MTQHLARPWAELGASCSRRGLPGSVRSPPTWPSTNGFCGAEPVWHRPPSSLTARSRGSVVAEFSVPLIRRVRHRLRTHVSEHPAMYLPFARRKYPGPSQQVISPRTELVIDGY